MVSTNTFYNIKIAEVIAETDDSICVVFSIPEELKQTFAFRQGQYLTLKADIDGQEVRRAYSICSSINDRLRVAIKRVEGGVFSNFANDTFKAGMDIEALPPQGQFFTELDPSSNKKYMFLAAGSGITPILSNLKTILEEEPESHATLIYSNRRSTTMMFREELSFIKNRYMNRFQWINLMTQEDQGSDLLAGRLNNEKGYLLQKNKLIDIKNTDCVFICGPEAMMSEVSHGFRMEGLTNEQIHYELFGGSSEDSEERIKKAQARVKAFGEEKTSRVTIKADGRAIAFNLAAVGENILDAGISNGLSLPYSCKAGVCSTCKCKLVEGQVDMDISHGLEQHEIDAGFILSCQSHPVTDEVVVDFDQR